MRRHCLFAQLTREVCFCKAGWRGARCLSQKMCIIALSCLQQREWLCLAPCRKPQSLNYAPEIAFGRAAIIWRFIFLFQLAGSPPS